MESGWCRRDDARGYMLGSNGCETEEDAGL